MHCSYSLLSVDSGPVDAGANILLTSADPRPKPTPDVILSVNMLLRLGLLTASAVVGTGTGTLTGTFAVSKLLLIAVLRGILFICEVFVSSIFRFYN
jgi:hypothetical protein